MLQFEGLDNVRDIGGMPVRGGGRTRDGVLLRSASLHYLTPADVDRLVGEFGLSLVLDLRRPDEIENDGPTLVSRAGVETVALTFIGETRDALPKGADTADPAATMVAVYLAYLADHPENVVEAVRRLAAADAGPALVHCLAGKDRTGTLVALVLEAVGVERAAVVADYAASAENVEALFVRWTTAAGEPMPGDIDKHKPRAATMTALLASLDETDGGAAGWLLANGLTEDELASLRKRFVEEPTH